MGHLFRRHEASASPAEIDGETIDSPPPAHPYPGWLSRFDPQQHAAASYVAFEHHVDALLEIEPGKLDFIAPIGEVATAAVTVRNPDEVAHALEPAQSIERDPFHDFRVEQTSTIMLAPGEQRTLHVTFQPSRRGRVTQRLRLDSDGGMGPGGELEVSGTGTDRRPDDQRIAEQDYEAELALPKRDHLSPERIAALKAVDGWALAAIKENGDYAYWLQKNWTYFIGKTGGDIHQDGPGLLRVVATHLAAKSVADVVVPGNVGNRLASKAVQRAVAKLIEFVYDRLRDAPDSPSPEQAALDASEKTAGSSIERGEQILRYRRLADAEIEDTQSAAKLKIAHAASARELADWASWGAAQADRLGVPDVNDLSLARDLLAEWVLERAATPTRTTTDTNSTAWKAARGELAKSGALPTLERNDLFVHQCRHEWSRLGLDANSIEREAAVLDSKRAEIEHGVIAEGGSAQDAARVVAVRMKEHLATFHESGDWRRTSATFAANQYQLAPDVDGRVFQRPFTLYCTMALRNDGGAVVVENFVYSLSGHAGCSDMVRAP